MDLILLCFLEEDAMKVVCFKCKDLSWVAAENEWNKLAAWQLFLILYQVSIPFSLIC